MSWTFDFLAALLYVKARLTLEEHRALLFTSIKPVKRKHPLALRGCFVGEQAERDPVYEDALREGTRAHGQILVFLTAHKPNDLVELAVTIHHEVDHALGFNEVEVLQRAAGRRIALEDVASYRPYWKGHRVIYPKMGPETPAPVRRPPPRRRPVMG